MREVIKSREITALLHFTAENNIDSIIEKGLIPRAFIKNIIPNAICNDNYRYDNRELYNCLSITFPNNKMFYTLRMNNIDVKWGVIGFNINILFEYECLFCFTNAANSCISCLKDEDLKGRDALKKLFGDVPNYKREDLNLPINFPTDPQAEVLIKGVIHPKDIIGICFNDYPTYMKYKEKYPDMKIVFSDYYFNTREFSLSRNSNG